jgi:hypothetical protein
MNTFCGGQTDAGTTAGDQGDLAGMLGGVDVGEISNFHD